VAANLLAANLCCSPWRVPGRTSTQGTDLHNLRRHPYLPGPAAGAAPYPAAISALSTRWLAPLVTPDRDLLREYEVAGGGKVRVE